MVDVNEIINKLEASNLIRPYKVTGDWHQIYCPFHNDGKEKKPSCGILMRDQYRNGQLYRAGMFHCFSCSATYSLAEGVTKILQTKSLGSDGLQWLKDNIPGFDSSAIDAELLVPNSLMSAVSDKYMSEDVRLRTASIASKGNFVTEEELASYRYTVPYMYERKLTDDIIEKYDVGYDANHVPAGRSKPLPCITFPVRDRQGRTLFFCRRSIVGKYFNYPRNVTKPCYGIYELPKDCRSVVVCESAFNCLTAVRYGYNAIALLGTGNSYQLEQMKKLGVNEYILCLDNDEAGRRKTEYLKKELSGAAMVWVATVPEGKDVNDLTKEEFDLVMQNKE